MLLPDVRVELLQVLLQRLPVHSANEAQILLVVLDLLPLVPQLRERVNHNAAHDVREEQGEEHEVNRIQYELYRVPLRHRVPDHARRDQRDHAADYRVARILWFLHRVDIVHVLVQPSDAEHVHEEDA